MLRYQDIPYQFNVASYFVDRNLADGRGERTALITDGRRVSYAELAATVNRIGNVLHELGVRRGQRVLLACGDGLPFVAAWYARAARVSTFTISRYGSGGASVQLWRAARRRTRECSAVHRCS